MNKIRETDLFAPIKELLEKNDFKVCGEVNNCDIVAMKEDEVIIVELKTGITLELIFQAIKRQRMNENVYIGVPRLKVMGTKKWKDYILLMKRLGLGLIVVTLHETPYAEIWLEPSVFDLIKSMKRGKRKKQKLIKEFSGRNFDANVGGSRGSKIMTAYKDKSLFIACCLLYYGPLSPKQLKKFGSCEKKTNSILIKNFNHWFYRIRNGLYDLSDEGKKAIDLYEEISTIHLDLIKKETNK